MDNLEKAGLYGNGLVEIDSSILVNRYNECMAMLGLPGTTLQRFRVDGVGWSPDIAEEFKNPAYLSHGDSSPLAVILTPDQQGKPVYTPFYSYQRQLMRELWNRYGRELADLTSQAGVCVELDHGISQLRSPFDILLGREVTVRTTVPGLLIKAFNEQRALIAEFSVRDDGWFNPELRECIIQSAKTYGDLRSNHFLIPEWTYQQPSYFRTSAFNGLFVLRDINKYDAILIHEDPDMLTGEKRPGVGIFDIHDKKWLNLLLAEDVVAVNTEDLPRLRSDIRRIRECILADTACELEQDLDLTILTTAQRRALVQRLAGSLPEVYFELERIEIQADSPDAIKVSKLSTEVQHLLCQPVPSLSHDKRKLLCLLLSQFRTTDIWRLYRHNKHGFYQQYRSWNSAKQGWAIHLITDHLKKQMTD